MGPRGSFLEAPMGNPSLGPMGDHGAPRLGRLESPGFPWVPRGVTQDPQQICERSKPFTNQLHKANRERGERAIATHSGGPRGTIGDPWAPGSTGIPWGPLGSPGIPWGPLGSPGIPWDPLDPLGSPG